ncbi:ATP-binding protein [Deferribacter thermophilus]|uniref:PAS domain-containing sensor histidine kinase n=1 Tax=Deferribacter thermophilus TaxID=53573 RepID=UPI003C1EA72A
MDLLRRYFKYFETYEILLFLLIFLLFIFGSLIFVDYKSNSKLLYFAYSYQNSLLDEVKKNIDDLYVKFLLDAKEISKQIDAGEQVKEKNIIITKKNSVYYDSTGKVILDLINTLKEVDDRQIIFIGEIPYLFFHVKDEYNDYDIFKIYNLKEIVRLVIPKNFNFVIRKGEDVFYSSDKIFDEKFFQKGDFIYSFANRDYIVSEASLFKNTSIYIFSEKISYFRILNKMERVSIEDIFVGILFILVLILIRYYAGKFYYEREEIEQLFEIEHEKFESIVKALGEGVALINSNYECVWANSIIKGYSQKGSVTECYKIIWNEEKVCKECKMQSVIENKKIESFRKEYKSENNIHYFDVILSPLLDQNNNVIAVVELIRDITDIITLQLQVQENENYLRNILENIPDAIITFDNNFRILTGNKRAYELFGDDIVGKNIKLYLKNENMWKRVNDENIIENFDTYIENDINIPVRLSILKLTNDDNFHYLMIIRDMTKIRELESKLIEREKLSALGLLAGGVAHEINNPLVGILNFAQLLERRLPDDSYEKKLVKTIIEASKDTKNIVSNLLAFARHKDSDISNVDIRDSLDFAIKILGSKIKDKKVVVNTDIQCDTTIKANKGKLHQLLINLISNAIDAVEIGGKVDITFYMENGRKVLKVRDNGKGIPEEIRQRIFDPFFTTKGVGKGTGLGLAIVKSIVDEYNWKIEVESELNNYTEFAIYI